MTPREMVAVIERRVAFSLLLVTGSFVLTPVVACKGASRPSTRDLPSSCPSPEPAASSPCAVPVNQSCTYTVPTSRDVHCHCVGPIWDCGTPLGIDTAAPTGACPPTQPASGVSCTLAAPTSSSGDRPGCFYQVAMSVTHDCVCAHYPDHAIWDCGKRSGDGPEDANGCPDRRPLDDSLCLERPDVDCQYGYNLATTCNCRPRGTSGSAWTCNTVAQPPSPR